MKSGNYINGCVLEARGDSTLQFFNFNFWGTIEPFLARCRHKQKEGVFLQSTLTDIRDQILTGSRWICFSDTGYGPVQSNYHLLDGPIPLSIT